MKKLLALLGFVLSLKAVDYPGPPPPDTYVEDLAGVIPEADETRINELCRELEQKSTAEMAVLTVSTTEGEDIATYAVNVFNKWGVGQADKSNGVLLVVAVDDRAYFTCNGSGIEDVLTDAKVGTIQREVLVSNFRKGDYGIGIYQTLQLYAKEIGQAYNLELEGARGVPFGYRVKGWFKKVFEGYICPGLVILFVLLIIASLFIKTPKGSSSSSSSSSSYWSSSSSTSSRSSHSGGFSGGGFGGGHSSGGGAGGRW